MVIGADIDKHAIANGPKIALACGKEELAWSDLPALTNGVSSWLENETPSGSGIALFLPNCAALPILVLAIARAGRIAQVLDPAWPEVIAHNTCKNVKSSLLIAALDRVVPAVKTFFIDPENSIASLRELITGYSDKFKIKNNSEASFYVGFTSGSTGVPKGYRRTHVSWTRSFQAEAKEYGHASEDVISAPGSLSHSLFLYAVIHGLHIGATAIMNHRFRPAAILKSIEHYGATLLYAVPAQLKLLTGAHPDTAQAGYSNLRRVIASGSKWADEDRAAIKQLFPMAKMSEFYGASELSFVSVSKEEEEIPAGSVGRAFSEVDIKVMDNAGTSLPANETGQVFVRSPMVFEAYAGDETAPELSRFGDYVSVGDMGYLDDSGFLFLSGRKDRMIVTSGKNLFPEEIEAVLQTHPDVIAAAVVPLPDDVRGSRLAAAIATDEQISLSSVALIAYLRKLLPLYKVPRRYYRVADWPLTRSGKSDFAKLAKQLADDQHELLP